MNAILHVALADCRERLRRFGVVAACGFSAFLGYQVIRGGLMIRLGRYRGEMNAAWIGLLMATAASIFLSIAGFYLVRGNVTRDRESGVGQILAATPLRASSYVIGKFLGNAVVLTVVIAVLVAAAAVMLAAHGGQAAFDPVELVLPFIAFAMPVALGVAAVAMLFECVPVLRKPAGNILFFVLWLTALPALGGSILGFDEIERSVGQAILAQGGAYRGGVAFGTPGTGELRTFVWTGFDWARVMPGRALILAGVLAVLLALAILVQRRERFDTERSTRRRNADAAKDEGREPVPEPAAAAAIPRPLETPAVRAGGGICGFLVAVAGEFRLLVKGRPPAWYLVAAGLIIACLIAAPETTRSVILPVAWLWPILVWSELGVRESRYGVDAVLACCPSPVFRRTTASWTAAVLLALATGAGALARFAATPANLPGFFAGAVFVPSLALFLGVVGRTDRIYHIVMIALWYLGPVNGIAALDYSGATADGIAMGMPRVYGTLAAVLLTATLLIRMRRART